MKPTLEYPQWCTEVEEIIKSPLDKVSAHLMCVTPTAHWLEYVDWANAILAEPLEIRAGQAIVPERPGNGMRWSEGAGARYLA